MSTVKRIRKGDTVRVISGANKGVTAKVQAVLTQKQAVVLEGVGERHRKIKPTQFNPYGGHKDIHTPVSLSKVALVINEKTGKTSRVGYTKNADGGKVRLARQASNKEIK